MSLSGLQAEFLAEVMRVMGDDGTTKFYALPPGGTSEAQLAVGLARLRRLPSGIGVDELRRRLGGPPPADAE